MVNCTQGFIILNYLLRQAPVKLRNLQIYENCQVCYKPNCFNFFQAFAHISEIDIIQKIFRSNYFYGVGKKFPSNMLLSYFKMKVISDISI